ncbi:AAA family ATPase [Candidatus Magnetomonas plexicatena]|uniref:AAA family ATPase n=1 Tax=Candidatus Magnetomonas plexicatena TaxID=2552947 RepID=UPI0011032581|nr:ATP-binding protein [Nitrospirales bacterium LBB_01]
MIITKLEYSETVFGRQWELKNTDLGVHNLIIGLNATGKTRLLQVILDLKSCIMKSINYSSFMSKAQRSWYIEFLDTEINPQVKYEYTLKLSEEQIELEKLEIGEKLLINRSKDTGKISPSEGEEMIDFSPPEKELTVNVRRDKKEFPFLEKLWSWADDFLFLNFTQFSPHFFMYKNTPERFNQELVISCLEIIIKTDKKSALLSDFVSIGYNIKDIDIFNSPYGDPYIYVEEESLKLSTNQHDMSPGMLRALSTIIIVEAFLIKNTPLTLVIDDIGEGLDFERSSKLTKLIMEKLKDSKIQLIAASNDRFLINAVYITSLNVLERTGHTVESFNYKNNREAFDEFVLTGLNNFDILSGKMYKEWGND